LRYTPPADENGAGYTSFTFRVQDDGGVDEGGIDTSVTTNTITLNVTAVNSAPTGENFVVNMSEDAAHVFAAADFVLNDSKDTPANSLAAIKIETLPAIGLLSLNGTAVAAGDTIAAADIANLSYAPVTDDFG